jgi:hypothetical protein
MINYRIKYWNKVKNKKRSKLFISWRLKTYWKKLGRKKLHYNLSLKSIIESKNDLGNRIKNRWLNGIKK